MPSRTREVETKREALPERRRVTYALRDERGTRIDIEDSGGSLGSGPTVDVRIDDPLVSRRHGALEIVDGKLRVIDLQSTNGTFVNGVRIDGAWLVGGESVRVGQTTFTVEARLAEDATAREPSGFGRLVGGSAKMRAVYAVCARLAQSDVPVVIEGETGTGKELVAECLHEAGARSGKPFVVIDAAALPEKRAHEALFGTAENGGKPGLIELADGGALFLDDPAALDGSIQAMLLRAVARGEVRRLGEERWRTLDLRVIAASTRDLDKAVESGTLRDDLYFRLAGARIALPPLRRRGDDVRLLAAHFWGRIAPGEPLPDAFMARFAGYHWPGNVRELEQAVARHHALGDADARFTSARAPGRAEPPVDDDTDTIASIVESDLPFPQARQRALDAFEREYVERVLAKHGGNVARAAAASGVARRYFQMLRARQRR